MHKRMKLWKILLKSTHPSWAQPQPTLGKPWKNQLGQKFINANVPRSLTMINGRLRTPEEVVDFLLCPLNPDFHILGFPICGSLRKIMRPTEWQKDQSLMKCIHFTFCAPRSRLSQFNPEPA